MVYNIYLGVLLGYGLLGLVQSAEVIALDDNIDEKLFVLDEASGTQSTVDNLHIFQHKYYHKLNRNCISVISFQPTLTEFFIDSIQVTCDIEPSMFHDVHSIVNIADQIYIGCNPGSSVWALFRVNHGCIQRRYTDDQWTPLDDIEELQLTSDQCFHVLIHKEHTTEGVPVPSGQPSSINLPFPELGSAKGEIVRMDDSGLEDYVNDADTLDKEVKGAYTKVISTRARQPTTNQCVDIVHIDMDSSEDFLDTIQLTCDDSPFVKGKGLIAYRGLVYLCDRQESGNPVWAVFAKKDRCKLRIYTDGNHKIIEKKSLTLSWDDCKKVINTQKIDWLPKDYKKPTSRKPATSSLSFSAMLTYIETLIATQVAWIKSKFPSISKISGASGPLAPQPIYTKENTPVVLADQPLTGSIAPRPQAPPAPRPQAAPAPRPQAPPIPTPPNVVAPTPTPDKTAASPGLVGGFMNRFGLGNNPAPAAPQASPPPAPVIPQPPPLPAPPVVQDKDTDNPSITVVRGQLIEGEHAVVISKAPKKAGWFSWGS